MVRVSSPAKLRPWSELAAQNGDRGGSCVGDYSHFRSRPGKPNQRKGQNEKFTNFAIFGNSGVFP